MGKTRKNVSKRRLAKKAKKGGKRTRNYKKNCGCSSKPPLLGGKSKRRYKKTKRTKKQKGGFFREIRNVFDYGYYLGEKQAATLGGYKQPVSTDPTKQHRV